MGDANIKENELLVLKETEHSEKYGWKKFRVIRWIVDGKPSSVKLEKRGFYATEDGDIRMRKAEGLDLADLELLEKRDETGKSMWTKVKELMKNPPKWEEPAPAAAEETINEVPF